MQLLRSALLITLGGLALWGQADANKGQLFGTVLDAKGGAIPGASIRIKNVSTGSTREIVSSNEGQFRVVQLDPGAYQVEAQASGFALTTMTGITLNVGMALNLDIQLAVQGTTQTIEVSASVSMLSSAVPAPTTVLSGTALRNLPSTGAGFRTSPR